MIDAVFFPGVLLLLTIVIEGLIAAALFRRFCWIESTSIQLTTWPVAQLLAWRTGSFWTIELGVVVVETVLWRLVMPLSLRRAALVSLATNAVSAFVALLM
ncbi:MAG: hypothetical protein ACXVIJ_07770 [Thermoanaerobaculia bacterium]